MSTFLEIMRVPLHDEFVAILSYLVNVSPVTPDTTEEGDNREITRPR